MRHWIGFLLFLPGLVHGQSAEDVARRAEAKLRSYQTLRADFKQVYHSASMSTSLEEEGRLFLRKPGRMKWEYLEPEKKIYLIKDNLIQEYTPEEKLMTEQSFSSEDGEADVLEILGGRKGILDHYTVEFSPFPTDSHPVHQIKLTPLEGIGDTYLLLEIDARTWHIRTAVSFDWAGNRQEFHFSKIKTDVRLPADTFELDLPADVEIIRTGRS